MRRGLAAAAGWLILPGAAAATHLDGFVFTFPGLPHGQEWRLGGAPITRTATSSWSGPYLGSFGEETVTFQALDVLGPPGSDPDFETYFKVVANGKTLFDSTVSMDSLLPRHFDLIFDFTPIFPDCCTDVTIAFSARFGPGYDEWEFPEFNPRWGLDNVVMSSAPIPEPATGGLVGLGLLLLAARKRWRGALL